MIERQAIVKKKAAGKTRRSFSALIGRATGQTCCRWPAHVAF